MVFNKNKSGQAAIEFLMTYGWMLLVVLIVGALIFSFVDFGALLPNKLDLTGNLRADSSQILVTDKGQITIIASYVGAKASNIDPKNIRFEGDLGFNCNGTVYADSESMTVTNLDTSGSTKSSVNPAGTALTTGSTKVNFINGQLAKLEFDCGTTKASNFMVGDVMEGEIIVPVNNTRTGLVIDSRGRLRGSISQG